MIGVHTGEAGRTTSSLDNALTSALHTRDVIFWPHAFPMQRIAIIGRSGGGKSTLARRLGAKLGLPIVHLDALYWRADWRPSEAQDFRDRLAASLAAPAWICDGNYTSSGRLHLERADTIVWVDQPRLLCLRRAIVRSVRGYGRTRADMAEGCGERLDLEFLRYIWNWDRKTRPKVEQALKDLASAASLVRLRSDAEIEAFLGAVPTA